MSEQSQVVVGYDFSNSGHAALTRAVRVVGRAPWHVLHIVAVCHPRMPFPAIPTDHVDIDYADRVQLALSEVVTAELAAHEVTGATFFTHARIGKKAAPEILAVARDVGAELIIVGCKGLTGIERAMLGSTAERIVREARCTVEVAKPTRYPYVPRLEMSEKAHEGHYVPPHRYYYEDERVLYRPHEWPLY